MSSKIGLVRKRWKPHLQIQKENWKYKERGWLPLWVSRPKQGLQKYKKARYDIRNVSKKDLSNIIKGFEKFGKLPYEKKRPKYDPTDSYFYPEIQLAKCMMISNNLNWHNHSGYTEMTDPSLNINATGEDESKPIIVHKTLSENCSTDVSKLKHTIVNET